MSAWRTRLVRSAGAMPASVIGRAMFSAAVRRLALMTTTDIGLAARLADMALTDPSDTIDYVEAWSEPEGRFVMAFRQGRR